MEKKTVLVCVIAGTLGLLSTVLAFAAEIKRIKLSEVTQDARDGVCVYPESPAFALGFTSAVCLLVAVIILSVASGCYCCCATSHHPSKPRCECNLALVCFIFSWITFVPAFLELLSAAILNNRRSLNLAYFENCYVVRSGSFAGSACLAFVSVTLGIIYYILFITSGKSGTAGSLPSNGIAMGHPQVPPTTQEPAFVHEDTYMRRQFT